MIPAHFVTLQHFPLTPNKKVDRKALPAPQKLAPPSSPERVAPKASPAVGSDITAGIAGVWSRILGVQKIGPDDNFFALGGHSLLAVQAHREMRDALGLSTLAITDIFRFPTLSGLARHLGVQPAARTEVAAAAVADRAQTRADAMSRRRNMRANRGK
jgi:hypothetical protein